MAVSKKFRWINEDGEILEVDIGVKSENVSVGEQSLDDVLNTKADKQTPDGGFIAGEGASADSAGVSIGKNSSVSEGSGISLGYNSRVTDHGIAIGSSTSATAEAIAIGSGTTAVEATAIGNNANAKDGGLAIGDGASATGYNSIQIGYGTNSDDSTFKVKSYTVLDEDGHIPPERIQKATTPSNDDNSDNVATTAFVNNALEDVSNIANLAHLHYGLCSTAAATAAKVVNISNFKLVEGAEAWVYFSTANTADNPTLNINDTGAKAIYMSTATGIRRINKNLQGGLYQMVYRNGYYYAFSHILMPSHRYVYEPDSTSIYTYNYGYIITNTGFPTPNSDTLLLPGTYTRTSSSSTVSISNVETYVKGYNKIDKKQKITASYNSILNIATPNAWGYTISSITPNSVIFEDLYFKLTSSNQYGILQATANKTDRVIKFKNCVFDIQCIRAFYITSGNIEFENCSFFVTPLTTNDCTHIVEAITTSSNYTAKVSFNNCYFKCTEDDTDKHIYLASLSGYHTRLDITDCELVGCNPYKTEGSTYTSSTLADCNIKITNNSIESIMIGPFDASSSGYQNGCFIFSNNIWTIPNSEVNGANVGMFIVHGGTESVINNNTIMVKSNAPVTFSYWKNLSTGRMLNTFTGNTSNDTLQLYSSGTGNAFLTFTSNTVDGVPTIGTFSDVTNANNTTT